METTATKSLPGPPTRLGGARLKKIGGVRG